MRILTKIFALMLAISAVFATFTACSLQPGYEGAPEGMRPINEGDEGAILYVPSAWSVETSTGVPTAYVSSNDRTTVTLTTVTSEANGGLGAKDYFESYIEIFKSSIPEFKFVKEKEEDKNYTNRLIANVGAYVYTYSGKVAGLDYKFRQALLNDDKGTIYIITYSATSELFDRHTEELNEIYDNFRFVTESIPMRDATEIETPDTEGITVPDGMKLISSVHTDYYLFASNDWIPTVTTGMTSAHAPNDVTKSISCAVFTLSSEKADFDVYWETYESDVKNTFGNISYESEAKFSETEINGLTERCYTYSVQMSGKTTYYAQYLTIRGGQIYIVTASSDSYSSAKDIKFELRFK